MKTNPLHKLLLFLAIVTSGLGFLASSVQAAETGCPTDCLTCYQVCLDACGPNPDSGGTESAAYIACENLCQQNYDGCLGITPNPPCLVCLPPYGFSSPTCWITAPGGIFTNTTYHTMTGSLTLSSNVTGIAPLDLNIATFVGTNALAASNVSSVDFYETPTSDIDTYGATNLPWTYIGSGSNSSTTGFSELKWTPPLYQGYVINAQVQDPTLTNIYTNIFGIVTNGGVSLTAVVGIAPSKPQLVIPTELSAGQFLLKVVGPVASNCTVQVSSDLIHWDTAAVINQFCGAAEIIDATGSGKSSYYRALLTDTEGTVEDFVYQGLTNHSHGAAELYVTNLGSGGQDGLTEALYVTNLGSGGQDGLTVTLPAGASGLTVSYLPLDPANTLPVGAYLEEQATGPGDETFGTSTAIKECAVCNGSNWGISADFSDLGATNYIVQAYLQGNLVGQFTNVNAEIMPSSNQPVESDVTYTQEPTFYNPCGLPGYPACYNWVPNYSWEWPAGNAIGMLYSGTIHYINVDQLILSPNNPTVVMASAPTAFQLGASQIPSIGVTFENEDFVYQGLTNHSHGAAELYVTNLGSGGQDGLTEALYVTNLGSGGQDGLTVTLPAGASGLTVSYLPLDPANTLPVGAYLEEQATGPGGENFGASTAIKECAVCNGSNWGISADFSEVGASNYIVEAYLQGNLVGQITNANLEVIPSSNEPSSGDVTWTQMKTFYIPCGSPDYAPCYTWVANYSWEWPGGNTIRLYYSGAAHYLNVDQLILSPSSPAVAMAGEPAAFQLSASQIPSIGVTFENEDFVYQGLTNHSHGAAELYVTNLGSGGQDGLTEALYVTNLGSGGQDGLSVTLPAGTASFNVSWQPLDVSNTLPVGAYLKGQVIGTAGSVSNGVVGSVTVTKAGAGSYAVTASAPSAPTNVFNVAIYNGSSLVAAGTGLSGTLFYASQMLHDEDDNGRWTWPQNTTFTLAGTNAVGNSAIIVPVQSPSIISLTQAWLLASGVPGIVITNETARGSFSQLQVLLPGETNAPFTLTGKTGSPAEGNDNFSPYPVTVLAVDANWNPIATVSDTISLSSSDGGAVPPNPQAMVQGTVTFSGGNPFIFGDAGNWTITASDTSNTNIPPATSSTVTVVP